MNSKEKINFFMFSSKKSKRAETKILVVYWFFILFIVAGGVVYMAALHYGKPFDVRKHEADILINQVADCISWKGYIINDYVGKDEKGEQIFLINNENFLEKCKLNFQTEDEYNWNLQGQYFVKVVFEDFNKGGPVTGFETISAGNYNLQDYPGDDYSFKKLERSFYTLLKQDGKEDLGIKVTITAIVRKTEKNVQ